MSVEDNILYAKRNIVDSVYSESRLAGIIVTFPDTYEICLRKKQEGICQ